jgi:D-lyxose ketol-isomerase
MKRSEINKILENAKAFMAAKQFVLPLLTINLTPLRFISGPMA